MSQMLYKTIQLKAPDEPTEDRRAPFVFSTADMDRDGEILEQNWRLENFLKNPIALFAHDRRAPIGRAENVGVLDGTLKGDIIFASGVEKAEEVYSLYKQGVLRTVSVGFVPHSYRWEMRNGEEVLVFDDNELVEISVVTIPSNTNAVALAMKSIDDAKGFTVGHPSHGQVEKQMAEEIKEESPDRVKDLEKELEKKDLKITALEQRCKDLEDARNEQQTRADELTVQLVERDLDSLIGKQITPAEKDSLLKLAKVDKALFEEHLSAVRTRPEMATLKSVIPANSPEDISPPNNSDGLASLASKMAFGG